MLKSRYAARGLLLLEVKARTDFGSLREHFRRLVSDCESALNSVLASFGIKLER